MNNRILNFFLFIPISLLLSCGSDDESSVDVDNPILTDISVSTNTNLITFTTAQDLDLKIENALIYNYGSAQENETLLVKNVNSDSTLVTATIGFRVAFQDKYIETNSSNNSTTITLEKEIQPSEITRLDADGPGGTYDLITSVLAPGNNPIEVPDCNHAGFGDHIDEVFDTDLNTNVFRFYMHTTPDNDRCINFDRQRNEIKSYDQSPDNLLGIVGETVVYKWKFKLPEGFQSSPNFTHIHQLKSVGGPYASMPMYTLTTRKGNPDRIELRYAEIDSQSTIAQTSLAPFINEWVEVTETIKYGINGTYDIVINKVSDNSVLLEYTNNSIINWREDGEFVRPKWGIYRSLINDQDLRDESLLFANFSIEEL